MISEEKKIKLTKEITTSLVFQKSPKSSALLLYLVKASINGSYLKEDIIDHEFFGSKSHFDKNNPRVRVNVYNLRKKLKNYYETTLPAPEYRLIIDKGQYSVRFEKKSKREKLLSKAKIKNIVPSFLLILICIFLYIFNLDKKPSILWNDFLINKKTTTLFIGDAFGIKGKTITGLEGWTRDYSINNKEDYDTLVKNIPSLKPITTPANYSYITGMGAQASYRLGRYFQLFSGDFDIRFSSKVSVTDLKNGNTIYVGPINNENKFISLFNSENPYFKIENDELFYFKNNSEKVQKLNINSLDKQEDIAIVSRIPGPQNTAQFLFFSNHDMGVMATVEYFTNIDSLKVFEKKLNGNNYFTAIYKAKGEDRTNLSLETLLVVPF